MRISFPILITASLLPLVVSASDQWHEDQDLHLSNGTTLQIAVWKGEREPKALMNAPVTLDGNGHAKLANGKSVKLGYGNMENALATIEEGYRHGENIVGLDIGAQIVEVNKTPVVIVLGQVKKAGYGAFQDGMTLADALTLAGGFSVDADSKRVRILRQGVSIHVDCRDMGNARKIKLEKGDLIRVNAAPLKI